LSLGHERASVTIPNLATLRDRIKKGGGRQRKGERGERAIGLLAVGEEGGWGAQLHSFSEVPLMKPKIGTVRNGRGGMQFPRYRLVQNNRRQPIQQLVSAYLYYMKSYRKCK